LKDTTDRDIKNIKFTSADDRSDTITHEDRTIASLKTTISNLTQQIAKLEVKIREYTLAAQNALNNKNRILALSALRSKKLAEQNLTQRADTLLQLEEVFTKLEQAADQVEIVRVMQASTVALRTLHAQTGGVEKVEDVVEELRQEMANVEEVTNVMSDTGQIVDEGELDEELQAMEAAEREAAEKREVEITRRRLAELDRVAKARAEKEADLEESIGRLSNMSLEDGSRTGHAEQEKV
jgi:charged multivesicular body protein 7